MDSLPLTVCPSQLQLQSSDDQSLADVEARLYQALFEGGFIPEMSFSDPLPFPTTIPDPASASPSPVPEPIATTLFEEEAPLDEDIFADLAPIPQGSFNYEEDLPADYTSFLLENWEAANAAAAAAYDHQSALPAATYQHQPALPATFAAAADVNYEAMFYTGEVPVAVPVAMGQAPVTPDSSSALWSSDDGRAEPGWSWDSASSPSPGPAPGFMTPPGSGKAAAAVMATATAMAVEEMDWEALLAFFPAAAPPPAQPTFFLAPAPAPVPAFAPAPAPTFLPPPLTSRSAPQTTTGPSRSPAKPKTKAPAARRERKTTTRRRAEASRPAPGTFVFAPNVVPPPDVYVSAYTHTREYALDERGRKVRRRRYEDPVGV